MTTKELLPLLSGGDLRSKGKSERAAALIRDQKDFDVLMECMTGGDRLVAMRAADAAEKLTQEHPQYLRKHKNRIISLAQNAADKELVWHLAQLMPRVGFEGKDLDTVWQLLKNWALHKNNSRIVRVFALQSLWDMSEGSAELRKDVGTLMKKMQNEDIPSINSRIRKLLGGGRRF